MLLSMTGHGDAHRKENGLAIAIELRTINNRYYKLSVRTDERYASLESQIDEVVRRYVRRGTVQVDLRIDRESSPDDYQLNEVVLASYHRQLRTLSDLFGGQETIGLQALLALPGVVDEVATRQVNSDADWPFVESILVAALENLARMRADEGRAMAADLLANRDSIATSLVEIERLAPLVVESYRNRLVERVNKVLADHSIHVQPSDVIREVALLADRVDIAEEIVRLRSHLEQFVEFVHAAESNGRKLDFLIQEMFREVNTIGSKANDAAIARQVIGIKAVIERMREMIQNVE